MPSTNGHGPQSGAEKVALCLRVSSEEQRDRETIEIQREFLEQYCALYGLYVAGMYADDGVSGTVPQHERPEGRRLVEDAKAGKFDTVLVYKLDSLGRSLLVIVDAHDRLQAAGVSLRSATEPIDTSTASGRLIFQMLASFAEYERETIRERTRADEELEARREELAKRLAGKQAEEDRYVRAYAQEHISEEELDVYLADLKNQTDNLRLLLSSVEADLSHRRQRMELTEATRVWLAALKQRVAEIEEDTEDAFRVCKQLVKLLVAKITARKRHEDGGTEVRITYRFGPPPGGGGLQEEGGSFVGSLMNGSRS